MTEEHAPKEGGAARGAHADIPSGGQWDGQSGGQPVARAPARYPIPDLAMHDRGIWRREDSIRRSRFIVSVAHTPDPDAARAFIEAVRAEFADATHNCWAFAAGPPGDTARIGCSDDGEPHGTAGRPMLQQLLHGGVGEVAAVVTRYFGGVKLGTGGLVRAYAGMARLGLDGLPLRQRVVPARVSVVLAHGRAGALRRLLPRFEAVILSERHGADVEYAVELPAEHAPDFMAAVVDMAAGEALVDLLPPS